jgi:hypothetical protein
MPDRVKLLIEVPSDKPGHVEIESIWALPEAGAFRVDNIPFYAKGIAVGDVVSAAERNGAHYFDRVLVPSGHSTIRILFSDDGIIQNTRNDLRSIGCESEISDIPTLIAVDIPPTVSYENLKLYLDKGEAEGKWEYQEACLGFL